MLVTATAGERGLAGDGGRRRRRPGPTPERRARRVRSPARLRPGRGARLPRLRAASRPGRHRRLRPPGRRGGRPLPGRAAPGGAGGRPHDLRPQRWLRPPRPPAGAPGGDPRRAGSPARPWSWRRRCPVACSVGCSGSSRSSATRSVGRRRWAPPVSTPAPTRSPTGSASASVLDRKRAAMAAHGSQQRGTGPRRSLDRFVRMPRPCSGWCSAVSGTSSRADPAPHASTTCSHRYGARRRTRTTLCSCTPPTMEI